MKLTVYRQNIAEIVRGLLPSMKEGLPYTLILKRWYKPKTTGPHSQLNHCWGHATSIAEEIGEAPRSVIDQAREDGMSKGYSTRKNFKGRVVPARLSEANTKDAAILIEQLHEYADFLGIRLIEGEW